MGFTGLAEGFNHGDAGDEFDHGGGDEAETGVHFGGFLPHVFHHVGHGAEVERQGCDGQQSKHPVEVEHVGQQHEGADDCYGVVDGGVGDDGVDFAGVVLDCFADLAGVGFGEPGQLGFGDPLGHLPLEQVAEFHVGEVGDGEC